MLAPWLTKGIVRVVPLAFVTTSGGTALDSFATLGDDVIRRLGLGLVLGGAVALLVQGRSLRTGPTRRAERWLSGSRAGTVVLHATVFTVPFVAFWWLSTPHNMYPTNSRIHWVDYFVPGPRSDDFFYAFGQIPHWFFYDHPSLWHGINAGLFALSLVLVLRRLGFEPVPAAALALIAPFGSMVLLFADTGEDVLLSLLMLTLLVAAMTTHSAVARGLMLAAVITVRPEFVSMLLVYAACAALDIWISHADRTVSWWRRDRIRLHLMTFAWAAGGILVSQALFEVLGHRYMFTNGRVLDLGPLTHLVPIEKDGFTISTFSGAYIGHFFWVLPLGFLGAMIAVVPMLTRRGGALPHDADGGPEVHARRQFTGAFALTATIVTVLLHEAKPTQTFCVRYLSYTYPFVLIGGAIGLGRVRLTRPACARMLWVVAIASLFALPVSPLDDRARREARPETALLDDTSALRDSLDGRSLIVTFGGQTTRNALSYLFEVHASKVTTVNKDAIPDLVADPSGPAVVVAKREQMPNDLTPPELIAETDELIVFVVG